VSKPISPEQARKGHVNAIPDVVFDVFNLLLTERYDEVAIAIRQQEVVDLLENRGLDTNEIFRKRWLDIEPCYRDAGWEVVYDSPAYNESYEPTWTFRKPKKGRGE
jgi:hypothetical protein